MAEIEHFCDPALKDHPKFAKIADTEMTLYSANNQMDGKPPTKLAIGKLNLTIVGKVTGRGLKWRKEKG